MRDRGTPGKEEQRFGFQLVRDPDLFSFTQLSPQRGGEMIYSAAKYE